MTYEKLILYTIKLRYIDTLLLLPSIDGFINSYFNRGFRLENGIEPDFIERN